MAYMPMIGTVLRGLGLMDLVSQAAYLNHEGILWRDIDGNLLARLPLIGEGDEFGGTYQIGQKRMNELVLGEIRKYSSVDVQFGLRVVGIEDVPEQESVTVMAHQKGIPDDDIMFEARYVLGTDGTNSTVRRLMCIPFEGMTFAEFKMVGTDILFDFEQEFGYPSMNFFVHPELWGVVAFTGEMGDGSGDQDLRPQWRVAYVEPVDLPNGKEETLARARKRLETFLRGPKEAKIVRAESYWLHQRCAKQAKKGRVFLAGDALHVSQNQTGQMYDPGFRVHMLIFEVEQSDRWIGPHGRNFRRLCIRQRFHSGL
jgi:2-polyprenyl-6-methoxyphenol hydroxylase-like FAD-dependent oxidoreductase